MMGSYRLPLSVCDLSGRIIEAQITQVDSEHNRIYVPYIKAVEKDGMEGSFNGEIRRIYNRANHKAVVKNLTKYLETLFLKELSDEDNNPSSSIGTDTGRDKIAINPSATEPSKGEGSGGVYNSRGGRKPSGSAGKGPKSKSKTDMA